MLKNYIQKGHRLTFLVNGSLLVSCTHLRSCRCLNFMSTHISCRFYESGRELNFMSTNISAKYFQTCNAIMRQLGKE
jgi:hypothetical protein